MKTTAEPVHAKHEISTQALNLVFLILLLLLGATVWVAYLPLGWFNLVLAGVIALTKAALVVWFFMHLRSAHRLDAILFSASIFMLIIAAILSFTDYLTRW